MFPADIEPPNYTWNFLLHSQKSLHLPYLIWWHFTVVSPNCSLEGSCTGSVFLAFCLYSKFYWNFHWWEATLSCAQSLSNFIFLIVLTVIEVCMCMVVTFILKFERARYNMNLVTYETYSGDRFSALYNVLCCFVYKPQGNHTIAFK